MKEQESIPIIWVSREDLIHCRPDLQEQLEAMEDSDFEYIAEKIGDALQETYWLVMDTLLSTYLEDGVVSSNDVGVG
jgi:hypothetical protein